MTTINSTYSSSVFNEMNFNKQNTQTSRVNLEPQNDTFVSSKADKKSKKKKIAIGAGIAATIIAVAVSVIAHKKFPNAVKLKDIKFDKGIASTANGEKFTGIVKDKLKNGDKITLEYVDGVIQNSKRSGSRNFEKFFEIDEVGDIIARTIENGVERKFEFKDIKFDKGIARTANGEKFTGIVKEKLKNGDKMIMEYFDGEIQTSRRIGSRNFTKYYDTDANGNRIVRSVGDSVVDIVNVTQLKNAAVIPNQIC